MTVDDLHSIFKAARQGTREWNGTEWVGEWHGDRAGVVAIVRALRDELSMSKDINSCSACDANYDLFHEILGDAGEKVAAGEDSPEDRSPATDAAPAVCVWTETSIDPLGYAWLNSSCGLVDCHERDVLMQPDPQKHCPSCGKPIKFTEAK